MTDTAYKAGLRSLLDGSREALEHAIRDAIEEAKKWPDTELDVDAITEPIVEQLREIICAERALADDALRQIEVPEDEFKALVAKHRERMLR